MSTLGLDIGTKRFGYGHFPSLEFGSWSLPAGPNTHRGLRYVKLRDHLLYVCEHWAVTRIAYEDAAKAAGWTGKKRRFTDSASHARFEAVILQVAAELRLPFVSFHPSTLKKKATGSGAAKKPEMMLRLKSQYQVDVEGDDNAADALWCAIVGDHDHHIEQRLKKSRRTRGPRERQTSFM